MSTMLIHKLGIIKNNMQLITEQTKGITVCYLRFNKSVEVQQQAFSFWSHY